MYGHLTCPEIFWHVSDKRIGTVSNHVSIPRCSSIQPSKGRERGKQIYLKTPSMPAIEAVVEYLRNMLYRI